MKFEHFLGGSYESTAATADQERTVNWYPEVMEVPGATTRKALYPTLGMTQLDTATSGVARAHFVRPCEWKVCQDSLSKPWRMPPNWSDGREFAIIGETIYEIDHTGTIVTSADLDGGSNPSTLTTPATIHTGFDPFGNSLICSGRKAYYFGSDANSPTRITDLDSKADMGAFLDGYYIVLDAEDSTIYISAINDATSWTTGTDYAQRSLASDPWRSMVLFGRYLWLFGERTTEMWQDTGERFPFAPIPNALINFGIAAPWSAKVVDNTMVWLTRDNSGLISVIRAGGVNVQRISTHPVERAIAGYSDYSDAVADTYSYMGHSFYVLHFRESNATWVWDAKTNEWHERGTWNSVSESYEHWRPLFHAYAFGELRCLDGAGGGVYKMDATSYTDIGGGEIRRLRRAPAIMDENKRVFFSGFEVDLEPGLGTSGQGENPQAMLRISDDGGKTWGSEHWASAGKTGEYSQRIHWHRLGAGRRRVFELVVSDPIPWRLTNCYIDAQGERK